VAKFSTTIVKRVIALGRVVHATFLLRLRCVRNRGFSIVVFVFDVVLKQRGFTFFAFVAFVFMIHTHIVYDATRRLIASGLATFSTLWPRRLRRLLMRIRTPPLAFVLHLPTKGSALSHWICSVPISTRADVAKFPTTVIEQVAAFCVVMFTSWPAAVVRLLTTHPSTCSNLFDNVSIMARAEVAKFSTTIVKRVIAFGRVMHATFLLQLRFVCTHGFSISLMVFDAGLKQRGLFVIIRTAANKEHYEHSNDHHLGQPRRPSEIKL
jgi:hypothetical protein